MLLVTRAAKQILLGTLQAQGAGDLSRLGVGAEAQGGTAWHAGRLGQETTPPGPARDLGEGMWGRESQPSALASAGWM